jgi:hypothetical protein
MKPVLRLLILLGLFSALPVARAADVTGTWKGAFDVHGTTMPLTINLKSDGNTVTGTVEGLPNSPADIHDGAVSGDAITFWVNADYQGQTYKLVYKGKIAADQIGFELGTADGSWSAPLTVKKSLAAAAAAPSPAGDNTKLPADVNGTWKGSVDVNGTPLDLTFRLKGSGNTVTGTIERPGAPPTEIHEGKVEGDSVSFWVTVDYEGQSFTIVYKGKVTPAQINFDMGTADQSWSASVSAKKTADSAPAGQPAAPAPAQKQSSTRGQRVFKPVGVPA